MEMERGFVRVVGEVEMERGFVKVVGEVVFLFL